jgi:hypothetical protein
MVMAIKLPVKEYWFGFNKNNMFVGYRVERTYEQVIMTAPGWWVLAPEPQRLLSTKIQCCFLGLTLTINRTYYNPYELFGVWNEHN